MEPLKPRDKVTQHMTRDGLTLDNQTTGESVNVSSREAEQEYTAQPEGAAEKILERADELHDRHKAKKAAKDAGETVVRATGPVSRLQFTAEERASPELAPYIKKAEKRADKLEAAKEALPKKRVVTKETVYDEAKGKAKSRLYFDKVEKAPPQLKPNPASRPIQEAGLYLHGKIHEVEHENVGVEGGHKGEELAERQAGRMIRSGVHRHKLKPYRAAAKAERKSIAANAEFAYQKSLRDNPELAQAAKNPVSRFWQKQHIKREYAKAARAAGQTAQGAAGTAKTTAAAAKKSIGVLSAMREQQAIAIGGNRYATFLQMNADQLHALEQDERLSYVGKSIYMGSLELSPSLTLGLMEYLDDNAAIYPSSTSVEEGRLPEAPMEIALSEDILKYLGFEGGIGDKITLSLQKNLRHNIVDSYSYTAEFVLTGRLKNNYLGYTSGTVTGVVGEGTAEQLLPESYIYYNVDIQTTDKKSFQAVVDDINKELNIHELDTSYNIVYLNALGISYTANSEDANDKGFSFMTVAGILVGSLILLAAGLVIYNILKISVSKRIKGYGTLRAIGGEKGQLYQIIVIEVILLCLMGIPIGMLLGFLSARGILEAATGLVSPELFLVQDASELKTLIAENSSLNGTLLVLSGAITLAFALFAALPAARSAARVSPIMAMSGTNLKIRRRKRKTKKIHNFEAYYARLNLKRNKGRTAITILSLVMSITVFIALQGFSSLLNAASALQDNHLGDYQITNESVGFTTDDLNTLRKNEAVQSVAAIQFSLYEQNENGLLDEISLEFQLKPGETFQVVGLNDEYWDYFMGDQLPEEQLGQLKSGNACIVRNPIPMSYGEDVLEFTNIEAGENICVAGMELNVLKTLDGYDGYLGIGNGGFTNGVQVIVDDAIYERLTGKDTYSEFLPTLNEGADREIFDTFIESFCDRTPGTTFLSYEESDQQLKESFAQIQMLAWGLILFVGLIGILNIINTVYTNIHTRVTEIGMQRAIGMSAGSLYKTFLWEGAYYGVIASVIGSVLGYVCTIFIEAATSDTIQLVAIPVMPILEATLLAVGACLLATAIPLRKISKMNIVDSIETVE